MELSYHQLLINGVSTWLNSCIREDIYRRWNMRSFARSNTEGISENQLYQTVWHFAHTGALSGDWSRMALCRIIPCKGTIVTPIDLDIVDQIIMHQRTAVESTVLRDFVSLFAQRVHRNQAQI